MTNNQTWDYVVMQVRLVRYIPTSKVYAMKLLKKSKMRTEREVSFLLLSFLFFFLFFSIVSFFLFPLFLYPLKKGILKTNNDTPCK